jgi:hypothetical protein
MSAGTHTEGRVLDNSDIQNPSVAHERTDVNSRAILMFGLWLTVAAIVVHVFLWGLYELFAKQDAAKVPELSAMRRSALKQLPREPALQLAPGHRTHPIDEMVQLRQHYDSVLRRGPISIEDAKRKMIEQSTSGATMNEFLIPTDMSSGRMMERRDK